VAARRTVLQVLQAALGKLIENGWIKDENGTPSKGYCMTGAIYASTKNQDLRYGAVNRLWDALDATNPTLARSLLDPRSDDQWRKTESVQKFNDRSETRKRQIISLYRKAIQDGDQRVI